MFKKIHFRCKILKVPPKSFLLITIPRRSITVYNSSASASENSRNKFNNQNNNTFTQDNRKFQIYEYKNANKKLKFFFYIHMFYIYGNSALLYFEIFDPAMGYFHGLMLSLSLLLGWSSYLIIGSILKKTVYKIYKIETNVKGRPQVQYRFEYLSFSKKGRVQIINRNDLVEYTQSNIERFYFFRNRANDYRKIYINPGKNMFANQNEKEREFKLLIGQGV